jgi:hypothetical protein
MNSCFLEKYRDNDMNDTKENRPTGLPLPYSILFSVAVTDGLSHQFDAHTPPSTLLKKSFVRKLVIIGKTTVQLSILDPTFQKFGEP